MIRKKLKRAATFHIKTIDKSTTSSEIIPAQHAATARDDTRAKTRRGTPAFNLAICFASSARPLYNKKKQNNKCCQIITYITIIINYYSIRTKKLKAL